MSDAKVVRVIPVKVVKARCDAAREARNAMRLTHKPFALALAKVKLGKKGK